MAENSNIRITRATCSVEQKREKIGKRVAAYARVSTSSDEQEKSFASQVRYYTEFIKADPRYIFVGMYADEGISGTGTKHRNGFNAMISDALDGKIDMIICKSIARFGRNTLDTINSCRMLRANDVDVFFEKENIHTLDPAGEMLLTIFSSFAQEESRSISQNTSWGIRSNFKKGIYTISCKNFLGYKYGEDGKPTIDKKEAKIIRLIYRKYLEGFSPCYIKDMLNNKGIKTPKGKEEWHASTVRSILSNERYCGDALLQKSYVPDFLTHRCVKNDGVLDMYYVKNGHPAIVTREVYLYAQYIKESRLKYGQMGRDVNGISGKIVCGDCLCYYGRKVAHAGSKYEYEFYRCKKKYENDCANPDTKTYKITDGFLMVLDSISVDKYKWQDFLSNYFDKNGIEGCNCFDEYKREFNSVTFNVLVDIVVIDGNFIHYIMRDGSSYTVENY